MECLAEVAACLLRKNASWPEFFTLIQAACAQNAARGAELLARMSSSAPQVFYKFSKVLILVENKLKKLQEFTRKQYLIIKLLY